MTYGELKRTLYEFAADLGIYDFDCEVRPGHPSQVVIVTTPITENERDLFYGRLFEVLPIGVSIRWERSGWRGAP